MFTRTLLVSLLICATALAVGTSTWNHTSEADYKTGSFEQVVATNLGDLKLSRAVKALLEQDPQVSAVYALAEGKDGTIYAGTGPNGVLLRIKDGTVSRVVALEKTTNVQTLLVLDNGGLLIGTVGEAGRVLRIDKPDDKESAVTEVFKADGVQYVWAIFRTADSNLYVATGPNGQLFEVTADGKQRVLFDSEENNLTALVSDGRDKLYVGTDPNGLVYRVDRKTGDSFVLYDAAETEISGLLIDSAGNIYASTGEAQEGPGAPQVPAQEKAGRPEGGAAGGAITNEPPKEPAPPKLPDPTPGQPKPIPKNLPVEREMKKGLRWLPAGSAKPQAGGLQNPILFGKGSRHPARHRGNDDARTMLIAAPATGMAPKPPAPPRPPTPGPNPNPKPGPASTRPAPAPRAPVPEPAPMPEPRPEGNAIYRIDRDGFVTEVFRQNVTIFSMVEHNSALLVATGGEGQIFQVRPDAEETVVVAKVEPKQVMSLLPAKDGNVYLGLANAGGVAAMSSGYASKGTFTSPVMDAGQISRFGKIHLDGSLPEGTTLTVATRSGNVKDAAERGWSAWSDEMPAAQFLQVPSPSARFLQYRLTFNSKDGTQSPVVEDVSVAYQVPNLPPTVRAVKVASTDAPAPAASGAAAAAGNPLAAALAAAAAADSPPASRGPPSHRMNITWEAADPNNDALSYSIYYRPAGADGPWIMLKDKTTETTHEWDTRSVADGKYQVRVVASDALANVPGAGKSAGRVSDAVLIDNTPPVIGDIKADVSGRDARVSLRVVDRTGTIVSAEYSVDSAKDWQAFLPSDTIWDSPEETAAFTAAGLPAGPHQIAVRATDSAGNVAYENVYVTVK